MGTREKRDPRLGHAGMTVGGSLSVSIFERGNEGKRDPRQKHAGMTLGGVCAFLRWSVGTRVGVWTSKANKY